MFAQDPPVIADIVPEQRFSPVVHGMQGSPEMAVSVPHRIGIRLQDAPDIVGAAIGVCPMPQEIKDAYESVAAGRADILVREEFPTKRIRPNPRVAEDIPWGDSSSHHPVLRARRRFLPIPQSFTVAKPATNPPTCAAYATPPLESPPR